MIPLAIALTIVVVAALVGSLARRRRAVDAPTQPRHQTPDLLDRSDFDRPEAPWLVAVFSSESCASCRDVVDKAMVLHSDEVAVQVVPFQTQRPLHERYRIDAVPCLVIADEQGVVSEAFLGPVTATDLWAAVAEARQPGSIDRSGGCDRHA